MNYNQKQNNLDQLIIQEIMYYNTIYNDNNIKIFISKFIEIYYKFNYHPIILQYTLNNIKNLQISFQKSFNNIPKIHKQKIKNIIKENKLNKLNIKKFINIENIIKLIKYNAAYNYQKIDIFIHKIITNYIIQKNINNINDFLNKLNINQKKYQKEIQIIYSKYQNNSTQILDYLNTQISFEHYKNIHKLIK